jgi:hypothetical protein
MNADQEEHLAGLAAEYLGPAAGDYLELLARFEAAHPAMNPITTCPFSGLTLTTVARASAWACSRTTSN